MQIVTSIPPRYAAQDRLLCHGVRELVAAVRTRPDQPNRPDEVAAVERLGLLEVKAAATDEAWEPKRFGPPLGSVFDIAQPDEPLAIINADIYMLGVPELSVKLAEICHKGVTPADVQVVSELGALTAKQCCRAL